MRLFHIRPAVEQFPLFFSSPALHENPERSRSPKATLWNPDGMETWLSTDTDWTSGTLDCYSENPDSWTAASIYLWLPITYR